ncbi:MAG: hypothetical protein SOZ34_01800 [Clostridia bacterium]|nr:hypothetical protein [Clostridia bacterium]
MVTSSIDNNDMMLYAAALVGKSKSTVDVNYSDRISQSSAMTAYTAGVKDKALELENKIKAANNVIRKKRRRFNKRKQQIDKVC